MRMHSRSRMHRVSSRHFAARTFTELALVQNARQRISAHADAFVHVMHSYGNYRVAPRYIIVHAGARQKRLVIKREIRLLIIINRSAIIVGNTCDRLPYRKSETIINC